MKTQGIPRGPAGARAELVERLWARREEIEQAALTRIYAISDPTDVADPLYLDGLRAAVSAALGYGLAVIEQGEKGAPLLPGALLTQARLAARSGVSLDTVLRRYFAGCAVLTDFVVEEAAGEIALQPILRAFAVLFDRLIATIGEEYARECNGRARTVEQRRIDLVRRLLAGELVDAGELAYDFDGGHLGLIATLRGAEEAVRELAAALDCRLLLVRPEAGTVWAWLGGRRGLEATVVASHVTSLLSTPCAVALGEPAVGLPGWRLTHRQAAATLPVAIRNGQQVVRYADVALLASVLQDDLLLTTLRRDYLAPLEAERDGGATARATLRAYFSTAGNISSAAAVLGVSRRTVSSRLAAIEERLGCPLDSVSAELETALRLDEIEEP